MKRKLMLVLFVAFAAATEIGAVMIVMRLQTGRWLAVAAGLHVVAVIACRVAARRRRPDLSGVESDLVLTTAISVPLFGPLFAWSMPQPATAEAAENAHAVFENYSEHIKPAIPDYERTLFTGDYNKDVARELDVQSYHEVLHHGTIDQKRSAMRRLAELGETKHLRLVRQCLLDPEHEVRLYAYSELDRASRGYEEQIAQRAREIAQSPDSEEALLAIARTYFEYAASGIHDEHMAAWYFRSAERYADKARRRGGDDPEPIWIQARSLGRLNEYEKAKAVLAELTEAQLNEPGSCITRAELAYRRRDFLSARAEAARLRECDEELSPWLAALEGERK